MTLLEAIKAKLARTGEEQTRLLNLLTLKDNNGNNIAFYNPNDSTLTIIDRRPADECSEGSVILSPLEHQALGEWLGNLHASLEPNVVI